MLLSYLIIQCNSILGCKFHQVHKAKCTTATRTSRYWVCDWTVAELRNFNFGCLREKHCETYVFRTSFSLVQVNYLYFVSISVGESFKNSKQAMRSSPKQEMRENKENQNPVRIQNKESYHFAEYDKKLSGSRCKRCRKTTKVQCTKCKTNLCLVAERNCFIDYHLENDLN